MNTFNTLDKKTYLFQGELDNYFRTGIMDKNSPNYNKHIYLVKIKRFDKDKMYVYSYIKYNILFAKPIVVYFSHRFKTLNLLREELKHCLVLIDDSVYKNNYNNGLGGLSLNDHDLLKRLKDINIDIKPILIYRIYHLMLYINYCCYIDDIVKFMDYDLKGEYYSIL